MTETPTTCDHCHGQVHPDINGYYVGADETSDCPADMGGHTVGGRIRA